MLKKITRTVVIGSGCAGLNAADWLYDLGERDFCLVTENLLSGTSRNTGSYKQTYYKLSLAGDTDDSVGKLARDLHYPDVNGDTALCEAASSAKCFFKLAKLGVPFPQNDFGEYVGYQTDHSLFPRATSAGPLTSRFMTEALEKSVKEKNIEILDHSLAVRILTDENGVCGLLCLKTDTGEWLKIDCAHVILCTGGQAVSDDTIVEAAKIAAYYSQARESGNVPVDYTPVKLVKKPSGGRPGMVIYNTYQTVNVVPDEAFVKERRVK